MNMARNHSCQVDHVIEVFEHILPAGKPVQVVAAASNREFAETKLIAAFRKNRKLDGWV